MGTHKVASEAVGGSRSRHELARVPRRRGHVALLLRGGGAPAQPHTSPFAMGQAVPDKSKRDASHLHYLHIKPLTFGLARKLLAVSTSCASSPSNSLACEL